MCLCLCRDATNRSIKFCCFNKVIKLQFNDDCLCNLYGIHVPYTYSVRIHIKYRDIVRNTPLSLSLGRKTNLVFVSLWVNGYYRNELPSKTKYIFIFTPHSVNIRKGRCLPSSIGNIKKEIHTYPDRNPWEFILTQCGTRT